MKFTVTTYWLNGKSGVVEPLFEGLFDFPSVEMVRTAAKQLVKPGGFPGYSLAIESDDGSISERWRLTGGKWSMKDA
jgi:hypothetical protein